MKAAALPIQRPVGGRGNGRVQRFVNDLRAEPGEWMVYPHPVTAPTHCASKYTARYPGTEWALDADGSLSARWMGD